MADISQIKLPDGTTYNIKTEKTDKVKCENIKDDGTNFKPIVIRNSYDSTTEYGTLATVSIPTAGSDIIPEIDLKTGKIFLGAAPFPIHYGAENEVHCIGYWNTYLQYGNPICLYEKLVVFNSSITIPNNTWTTVASWNDNVQFVNCIGLADAGGTCFNCVSAQYDSNSNSLKLLNTRGTNIAINKVRLQFYYVT